MAYTIKNTDGTTLLLLGEGKIDSNSTSITLVGKNYSNYGEIWNNNLIKIMGNFANSTAPINPVQGQLWYDRVDQRLNVYNNEWEPVGGARISPTQPTSFTDGDFWWDTANDQLYIRDEDTNKLVGPAFSKQVGSNGWVLPPVLIQDDTNGTSGNVKQVTLVRNYGDTLGYLANESFNIATAGTYTYITTATTSTVRGLTIMGDIRATEVLYANTLTVLSTIVPPVTEKVSSAEELDFWVEFNNLAFRIENLGATFRPQLKTVSGTVQVSYAGFYTKVGDPTLGVSRALGAISTTAVDIISGVTFDEVGDMLQIVLTDQTVDTEEGIRTYRITIQLVGSSTLRASISAEKLV